MARTARITVLFSGATALALTLAGCASSAEPGTPRVTITASAPAATTHNAADTEFAQMMIVHHEGAVEMADLVVTRAATEQVRTLGQRISAAQGPEIATMESWLAAWGEDLPDAAEHGAMDHAGMDMNGMDQGEAMAALDALDGEAFDRLFLELMIDHHRGAVEMSTIQVAEGENTGAIELARDIIAAQQSEIAEMEELLAESSL